MGKFLIKAEANWLGVAFFGEGGRGSFVGDFVKQEDL